MKNNTEGAESIEVDTLGEDKTEMKNAFKKRLREIREKARIKKKIELENERARKEAEEYWQQVSQQSPVFSVPSQLNSPTR